MFPLSNLSIALCASLLCTQQPSIIAPQVVMQDEKEYTPNLLLVEKDNDTLFDTKEYKAFQAEQLKSILDMPTDAYQTPFIETLAQRASVEVDSDYLNDSFMRHYVLLLQSTSSLDINYRFVDYALATRDTDYIGLTCTCEDAVACASEFQDVLAVNLHREDLYTLCSYVDFNAPVLLWCTSDMTTQTHDEMHFLEDGRILERCAEERCYLLVGYDVIAQTLTLFDATNGTTKDYAMRDVLKGWYLCDAKALVLMHRAIETPSTYIVE